MRAPPSAADSDSEDVRCEDSLSIRELFAAGAGVKRLSMSHLLLVLTRLDRVLSTGVAGRIFMMMCALSSPVDFGLDLRMGFILVTTNKSVFAGLLFFFIYMSLRLQLILFLATTARPLVESAKRKRWRCHGLVLKSLECCLEWPIIPEFTVTGVTIAWLPLGLQLLHRRKFLASLALEVVYAPVVIIAGPLIIVYGTLVSIVGIFSRKHFYQLSRHGQVQRIRSIVISAVSTSFQALPQLCIQATVYHEGAIPLNPHQTQIVVVSMIFSVLSLLRSICGILASWHKIQFIYKLLNRTLDDATFNAILSECGDIARSGDSVNMQWEMTDGANSSIHSLHNLRGISLKQAEAPSFGGQNARGFEMVPVADESPRTSVATESLNPLLLEKMTDTVRQRSSSYPAHVIVEAPPPLRHSVSASPSTGESKKIARPSLSIPSPTNRPVAPLRIDEEEGEAGGHFPDVRPADPDEEDVAEV